MYLSRVVEPEVGNVLQILSILVVLVVTTQTTHLVSGQDWTASVECLLITQSSQVQVVPVQSTAPPGGDSQAQQGEDCGSPRHDVIEVEEEGGGPVLVHQQPGLVVLVGVEVVNVGLIVASDTVGNNLQRLSKFCAEVNR